MNRQSTATFRRLISTVVSVLAVLAAMLHPFLNEAWPALADSNYVIQISVDGLGSAYLLPLLTAGRLPHMARLIREGASTLNARTDYDKTITLPNHTSQLTGRPVNDKYGNTNSGHRWVTNTTPPAGVTLHTNRGAYIAGVFDVAHDHGLSTALYASKDKFVLFDRSWNEASGALDVTGADNGRDKIDHFTNVDLNATMMFSAFKQNMQTNPTRYTFVHFNSPDTAGHYYGWGGTAYNDAVVLVDQKIGEMLSLIESVPQMINNTSIVLTADHGGSGNDHQDVSRPEIYTVPFILWGPHIPAGADLYALNGANTTDPSTSQVDYALAGPQPIRNGDAGNCALGVLGLPAIPGSSLDHLRNVCQFDSPATATPTATPTAMPTPTATPIYMPHRSHLTIVGH